MAGKLWKNDTYDVRKYKPHDIGTFVDIGGNAGTISLMACCVDPFSRVLMIEPFTPTLDTAKIKTGMGMNLGIEPHNIALGNGEPLLFAGGRHSGEYKFLTREEFDHWKIDADKLGEWAHYEIPSFTLPDLFEHLGVNTRKSYFVKVDCEGGERFIFNDPDAVELLKGSMQVSMEVHYIGFTVEEFGKFVREMSYTHVVRRTVQAEDKKSVIHAVINPLDMDNMEVFRKGGHYPEFTLVRKDWDKKRPSYSEVAPLMEVSERLGWQLHKEN